MPALPRSDEQCQRAVDTVAKHDTLIAAARALGIARTTLGSILQDAKTRGIEPGGASTDKIELPVFPDDDIPVTDILDHLGKRYEKRRASYDAHTWFKVKVKDPKPIGILWFGDPHLGDAGCDIPLLRHHCDLCATTEGVYGANIGDVGNNWSGKLAALYGKQETSQKTEQKLAEWFMMGSGVRWLIWLIGNHDAWGDGATVLAHMARKYGTNKIILHDWEARFSLVFPNGHEFRVWASHDFKGHSDWNSMHALLKAARLGVDADLLVGGHRHNYGVQDIENPDKGIAQVLVRARGYKTDDEYARRIGHNEQRNGHGVLTILDPINKEVTAFKNIDLGIRVLKLLRDD
jgi:hypothetical protein